MIRNKEDLPFPGETDLHALVQTIDGRLLAELLATEGVYLLCNKQDKPDFLKRFAFGQNWYADAFRASDRTARGIAISITGARAEINLLSEIETAGRAMENKVAVPSNKYQPRITKIYYGDPPARGGTEPGTIVLQVEYQVMKPAHTLMYSREHHSILIEATKIGTNLVEFRHNPNNSTDALVARDIITAVLQNLKKTPVSIDITALPLESRIELIDTILTPRDGWQMRGVTELSVKKHDDEEDGVDGVDESGGDESSGGSRKLSEKDTKLLNSAVLHGENLREHTLVKKFLEERYYFSSVEFFATKLNEVGLDGMVRVEISFKQTPRLLEISVGRTRVDLGTNQFEDVATSDAIAKKVGQYYWDKVYDLYHKISQKALSAGKRVVRKGANPAASAKTPATPATPAADAKTPAPPPTPAVDAKTPATPTPPAADAKTPASTPGQAASAKTSTPPTVPTVDVKT